MYTKGLENKTNYFQFFIVAFVVIVKTICLPKCEEYKFTILTVLYLKYWKIC